MIIGLTGYKSSGKNTVGDFLVDLFDFKEESFAESLKRATAEIFGWPYELLEGKTNESREFREQIDGFWTEKFGFEITPRWVLQHLGTEVFRNNFLDNIWIDSLEHRISVYDQLFGNVVITDVRFVNEIDFIIKQGGVIVDVIGKKQPEWYDAFYQEFGFQDEPDLNSEKYKDFEKKWPGFHWSEIARVYANIPITQFVSIVNHGSLENLKKNVIETITRLDPNLKPKPERKYEPEKLELVNGEIRSTKKPVNITDQFLEDLRER